MSKPQILISGCLLGQKVRYNGGHKEVQWLTQTLAPYVNLRPICPEVEMGLGVPREAMRLMKKSGQVRLITSQSQKDLTDQAEATAKRLLDKLQGQKLHGAILMGRSPSCGVERVKVYNEKSIPVPEGVGFFAAQLQKAWPQLPVIEAGRLSDEKQRYSFLNQLFTKYSFDELPKKRSALQTFHAEHKYFLMALDQQAMRQMGRLAAGQSGQDLELDWQAYNELLLQSLQKQMTVGNLRNAFLHIYGYFKKSLSAEQKQHLLQAIDALDLDYFRSIDLCRQLMVYENLQQGHDYLKTQALLKSPLPKP